jgi:hypothetical protein
MLSIWRFVAVLVLAGLGFSKVAEAQEHRYGVFCVVNRTDLRLTYFVKIGPQGNWQRKTIAPGTQTWFSHRYDYANERRSPKTWVRLDTDLRSGQYMQKFMVTRNATVAQSCRQAKKYVLRRDRRDPDFLQFKQLQ